VTWSAAAHADGWLSAELPAAAAVSGLQEQTFRAGTMPAVGAYLGSERISFGMRVRAGILRDGSAPPDHLADPGTGGLVTCGAAARFGAAGGWAEVVGGAGVTGHDVVPAFEAGLGWSFRAGSLGLGPSLRYVRVVASGTAMLGSADLVLVGIDVELGRHRSGPVADPLEMSPPAAAPPPPPPDPPGAEPDGDEVIDGDGSCRDLMIAGEPGSGCPVPAAITVIDDRIILDERVLFDTDRAHVKAAGRGLIAQIADAWRMHPEWKALTIEGHADIRGADDYNLKLSQLRAERVRDVLLRDGFEPDRVRAIGYGRSRPRDPGSDARAHERNRRVEFLIDRSAGGAAQVPTDDRSAPSSGDAGGRAQVPADDRSASPSADDGGKAQAPADRNGTP
jgi:outer membrane protein OmpA-like peptidoglycan-associated protein